MELDFFLLPLLVAKQKSYFFNLDCDDYEQKRFLSLREQLESKRKPEKETWLKGDSNL